MTHLSLTYLPKTAKSMVPARLTTRDGATLAFKTFAAKGPQWGRVLVLHGMGLNADYYVTLGTMLASRGLNVSVMDFRGHGESSGTVGDTTGRRSTAKTCARRLRRFGTMGRCSSFPIQARPLQ